MNELTWNCYWKLSLSASLIAQFHILGTNIFPVKESACKDTCPHKVKVYKLDLGIYADSQFCSLVDSP